MNKGGQNKRFFIRNFLKNRKGASALLMTFIIIIFSTVIAGIAWLVVINVIKAGTEGINLNQFTLNAGITNVLVDSNSNNISLTVKRNAGEGDLSGVSFVFSSDTTEEVITRNTSLKELEQANFNLHLNMSVSSIKKISVVPWFKSSSGRDIQGSTINVYNFGGGSSSGDPGEEPGCTPTTCTILGYACGSWNDGCGGMLNCGTCSEGQNCILGNCHAVSTTSALIIDHTNTNLLEVPDYYIEKAKQDFHIAYGHTSHGSQLVTGMNMLNAEDSRFSYSTGPFTGSSFLSDAYPTGDLGNPDRTSWADRTRTMLNDPNNQRNVVLWSWCGQVDGTEQNIQTYLDLMNQLEQEFPSVKFVYMTGHLTGTGPSGNVYQRNDQIRQYCLANNKTLFDFADIESYDPSGTYYPSESDACNWCTSWCDSHTCPSCSSCAHSHCFNCYQKGKAFWWMMARLAGWEGV